MRHRFTLPPFGVVAAAAVAAAIFLSGCSSQGSDPASAEKAKPKPLILASTTSTQDSGLFEVLIPAFEKDNPAYIVRVVAVGTGEALKLGEKKDADVLLVHSKKAEESFVASGFGGPRRDVMFNDFVVLEPKGENAGIPASKDAVKTFAMIADSSATFASRGDDSGTYKKEESLWTSAGVEPKGKPWYKSLGQGMGETLKFASEQRAYTLSDRATYLTMRESLELEVLVEDDKALFNQYGVIPVTGANNTEGAQAFVDWICDPDKGQAVIAKYGIDKFGEPLFVPNAD